jgi:hypothetical protein
MGMTQLASVSVVEVLAAINSKECDYSVPMLKIAVKSRGVLSVKLD